MCTTCIRVVAQREVNMFYVQYARQCSKIVQPTRVAASCKQHAPCPESTSLQLHVLFATFGHLPSEARGP